jgi:hypothetical protein
VAKPPAQGLHRNGFAVMPFVPLWAKEIAILGLELQIEIAKEQGVLTGYFEQRLEQIKEMK